MAAIRVAPTKTKVKAAPRLPRKVKAALADFQRRALELFPDDILAIILYGSYARGEATPDSDMDVMIVVNWVDPEKKEVYYSPGRGDPRWKTLTEAAWQARGWFSPLVVSEREFGTNLPIMRDAKREGIVLWQREEWAMPLEEEEHPSQPDNPQTWMRMAEEKLEEARKILNIGVYSGAIHTAYYAMFHASRGALLTRGLYLKKHSASVDKFSELFVHPGLVEEKYKDYLHSAQKAREAGDYQPYIPIPREKAAEVLGDAEAFIAKMKELVGGKQEEK